MARVLVVGGGLAAALVEAECARRGHEVGVRAGHASAASRVAAGMFNPVSFQRVLPVWRAEEHLAGVHAVFRGLEARLGCNLLHEVPVLKVFGSADYAHLWSTRIVEAHPVAAWLASGEAFPLPPGVEAPHGAGWVRAAGWVDVARLLDAWKALLQAEGRWEEREWHADEGVPAGWDAVMDCRGVGAREDLARWGLDLRPNHGEVLTVHADGLPTDACVNAVSWVLPVGEQTWRIGSTYRWDVVDDRVHAETQGMLVERVAAALPAVRGAEVVGHAGGVRPASPDRRPWIGELAPGHWVCNGLGTRGVLVGPWTVQRLVDAWEDSEVPVPSEVDVRRFRTFSPH